jgi:hypothetical protein
MMNSPAKKSLFSLTRLAGKPLSPPIDSMKKLSVSLISAALALTITSAFATPMTPITNIVNNSGFETGDFTGWSTGGNRGVDMDSAHSGTFGAFMGLTEGDTFVSQDLNTTAGSLYDLSFFLQGQGSKMQSHTNAIGGFGATFQVFWNGILIFDLANSDPFAYTQFSFTGLAATGSTTNLKFVYTFGDSMVNGGFSPLLFNLDDVVVNAVGVPESLSTLWLMLPAMGMFLVSKRQRRTA